MPWEDECQAQGQHPGSEGREGVLICEVGPTPPPCLLVPSGLGQLWADLTQFFRTSFVLSTVLDNFIWLP